MEKKPAIRFEGYTDAWEQRKLGEVCSTFLDGDWIESKDQSDSGVRLIQTGNIGVGTYIDKEDRAKWVSEDTFNRLHCEEVFAGDILISRLPEPAGRACIAPKIGQKMITAVDVTIARTGDNYDSNFILQFLCSDKYFKAVNNTLSGSTRQRISRSNLEQIPVPIAPTIQEQKQIGAYFSTLDHLITLHQRNYEKMVATKKSMLDKLFPQGDAKVPAIRFDGFVEDWEKKPLGELFEEYSEKGHEEFPTLTIIQGAGTIPRNESDRKFLYNKANLSGYKLVRKGDFIVHLRSFEGGLEIATTTGIISPAYHTLHGENVDSDFYYAYFRSRKFIDVDLRRHVYGIRDGRSIDINGMKTILIPYTSYEEQKQIADYLNSLDELIELYRIRIEKLKNIKAACLQGMFV